MKINYEIKSQLYFFRNTVPYYLRYFTEPSHKGCIRLLIPKRPLAFEAGEPGYWFFDGKKWVMSINQVNRADDDFDTYVTVEANVTTVPTSN